MTAQVPPSPTSKGPGAPIVTPGASLSVPLGSVGVYWPALRDHPPPVPPQLLKKLACKEASSIGKVKVLLRVAGAGEMGQGSQVLKVDPRKKTVTLFDPGSATPPPAQHTEEVRVGIAAPKMFTFDGIYTQEDSQTEVCSSALTDVIVAVLRGVDGAVFSFGQPNLGQAYTMLGGGESCHTLGVMPTAVWWLYRALQDHRANTGARHSVRVSALQIAPGDVVTDLLAQYAQGEQSPGVFLMEDSASSQMLAHAAEVRAPTVERAAHLLDAALALRHLDEQGRHAHLVFTLNIYQYSVDTSAKGGVAGGRSRLHLIDFGAMERGKGPSRLNLTALGNVILAIFNGQKHLPYKDGKLPRVLRECVGSVRCVAAMLVHVSPAPALYQETLATVQLASRVHRLRRRRIKPHVGGSGSGGSSEESKSGRSSRGTLTDTGGSSSVDPSSSEQSCDTVIYVGPAADDATDGEHPPVYLPAINSGDNRCSMNKALRGSAVDGATKFDSPRTPRKPSKASGGKSPSRPSKHPSKDGKDAAHASPHRTKDGHKGGGGVSGGAGGVRTSASGGGGAGGGAAGGGAAKFQGSSPGAKVSTGATPKSPKSPHVSRHGRHKTQGSTSTHGEAASSQGIPPHPGGSEEHWIDGPRFHRAKVYDGHKMKSYEMETWIDGPEATYGYMDDHKKTMIQKWVETQNAQVTQPKTPERSPKHHRQYKELTQFKTVEDEEGAASTSSPRHRDNRHREKRKSSECKEARRDGGVAGVAAGAQYPATYKDSTPRKRRSYGDKPHPQVTTEPEDAAKPKQTQVAPSDSPKSDLRDSGTKGETQGQPRGDKVPEGVTAPTDLPQKATPDANANVPSTTQHAIIRKTSEIRPVSTNQMAGGAPRPVPRQEEEEEEEEEVLQVICVEKETPKVNLKTYQEAEAEDQEEEEEEDMEEEEEEEEEEEGEEVVEEERVEVRSSVESTSGGGGDAVEDVISQESSEEMTVEEEVEEVVCGRKTLFFLREVRDLDEGEEELEAALDRWLAEEDREYIEVEEPQEPVEMVDSWCQVTEEDIERTLAEAGIPLLPLLPPVRHLLPPLQEEPTETQDQPDAPPTPPEVTPPAPTAAAAPRCAVASNGSSRRGSEGEGEGGHDAADSPLLPSSEAEAPPPGQRRGSSRYEQMIQDPNFTAKTHYFAQRLKELQELHDFYRNLAKQAPRGRNSLHSPSTKELEDEEQTEEDSSSSVSEGGEEADPKALPQPFFSQEGGLSSLKLGGEYELDWKSLLPDEIERESVEAKTDGEDTSSELSKETGDPLYDIQSDIMPYLPSNYVSLTTLSALRQPDGASNPNLNGELATADPSPPPQPAAAVAAAPAAATTAEPVEAPAAAAAAPPVAPAAPLPAVLQERLPGNGASLSDDENNVKQAKVKKEKRKKKLCLLPKGGRGAAKEEAEGDEASTSTRLSWSRFFGSPKHKAAAKDKKSAKAGHKSKSPTSSGRTSDKGERKAQRERERSRESRSGAARDKAGREARGGGHQQEADAAKPTESKNAKNLQKLDSERSNGSLKSKSPARKASDGRGSRSGRRESREQLQQGQQQAAQMQQQQAQGQAAGQQAGQQAGQPGTQAAQGQRYQGFHWDSPLPPFLPVTTAGIYPGYDSGADSGVGLKVMPRARRSRGESRHGESSGYESVIRDSECSSFGSSQDSGLDDDGVKGKTGGRGSDHVGDQTTPNTTTTTSAGRPGRTTTTSTPTTTHARTTTPRSTPTHTRQQRTHTHAHAHPHPTSSPHKTQNQRTMGSNSSNPNAEGGAAGYPTKVPVEEFDEEDVARYETHRTEEDIAKCRRTQEKIRALREKQDQLKQELEAAKSRLMIDKSRWSFELHVEECMTWRDAGYMEALQQETIILAKRVMAARSRLQLTTCFDASPSTLLHPSVLEGEPTEEEEEELEEGLEEIVCLDLPARLSVCPDGEGGQRDEVLRDVGEVGKGDAGSENGVSVKSPVTPSQDPGSDGVMGGSGKNGKRVKREGELEDWKRLKDSLLL
ncbi:kinesin-like protein KIF26B isoform X2 [Eriocheir sinensis]|uniref:kinesin-like protein KIF26B isoform X2 n=1 Tax=Eriocheir sinensis TaxID=95602 RepID=UPI0021CA5514|nr:kinesin-like protein KIF26B isoform X2 [Eriocheir sinensis]